MSNFFSYYEEQKYRKKENGKKKKTRVRASTYSGFSFTCLLDELEFGNVSF